MFFEMEDKKLHCVKLMCAKPFRQLNKNNQATRDHNTISNYILSVPYSQLSRTF